MEGLVERLCSHTCKNSPERIYSNLAEVYTYDGVKDKHISDVEEVSNLYQNFRYAFIEAAHLFDTAGEKENVIKTLNIMDEKLPETLLPYANPDLKAAVEKLRSKNL
jgi:hypothetical protein